MKTFMIKFHRINVIIPILPCNVVLGNEQITNKYSHMRTEYFIIYDKQVMSVNDNHNNIFGLALDGSNASKNPHK